MTSKDATKIVLPPAPPDQQSILTSGGVACWTEPVEILTYAPAPADEFPMFFERRVYQGSSGRIFPLPFIDRVASEPELRSWEAIHLENAGVRLMILPELGGRIHVGYDKHRDYDFFYRNNVIKPALVGIAGPWISGGIEFNWPQHHRPATHLPAQTRIERDSSGAVTVWCTDLDPLQQMEGTHGIKLEPDSVLIELLGKLHNRTDQPQTFMWWANVAAAVHEDYQAFFPPDISFVADHARRAISTFPRADNPYYGVDYGELAVIDPDAGQLDRYEHIPVPTSYMITDTNYDFFGGYDHRERAGFVHWADRAIAPGKKQWTWGNGQIGKVWDDQLTDADGPYIELMAGVFTDNQPDFSWLQPGETRCFSQFWFPFGDIGPVQQATRELALQLDVVDGKLHLGLVSVRPRAARVALTLSDGATHEWRVNLSPQQPWLHTVPVPPGNHRDALQVEILADDGAQLSWVAPDSQEEPWAATAPQKPDGRTDLEQLILDAQYLVQYRHPTRSPVPLLQRALELDPKNAQARLLLAELSLRVGDFAEALAHAQSALGRLTRRNLNPRSGKVHYLLGQIFLHQGEDEQARYHLTKATWDLNWALGGHLASAEILLRHGEFAQAAQHGKQAGALAADSPHAAAIVLLAQAGGERGVTSADVERARSVHPDSSLLAALAGEYRTPDPRAALAVAFRLTALGANNRALRLAQHAIDLGATQFGNSAPQAHLLRAEIFAAQGEPARSVAERKQARLADQRYVFPSGLEELGLIQRALQDPTLVSAENRAYLHSLLGCWQLGVGKVATAKHSLAEAISGGADDPVTLRNAAIAEVGAGGDLAVAQKLLNTAIGAGRRRAKNTLLPRLLYEADLLARIRGVTAEQRLADLRDHTAGDEDLLLVRDDLALSYVHLLLDVGEVEWAAQVMKQRIFQPFEGGEGQAIAAWDRVVLKRAAALPPGRSSAQDRVEVLGADLNPALDEVPEQIDNGGVWFEVVPNLGEGRHPAGPVAHRLVALGDARAEAGDQDGARRCWRAARIGGGLLDVAPRPARPDDYWIAVAHLRLGEYDQAEEVLNKLANTAAQLASSDPQPDYFATSLPDLLIFPVDTAAMLQQRAEELTELAQNARQLLAAAKPQKEQP